VEASRRDEVTHLQLGNAVFFALIVPPHLLTYDLTLALLPVLLVWFWDGGSLQTGAKWIAAVVYCTTAFLPALGFLPISVMPFIFFTAMCVLSWIQKTSARANVDAAQITRPRPS
jgi:hypothetical protein